MQVRTAGVSDPVLTDFREDIEGLRAVAVGLVLIYHADASLLSGGFIGVDIFFVISGFLITGLLLREVQRSGTVSLSVFYARRAKRLLPAAMVVLVSTGLLTVTLLPKIRWTSIGWDIVASAFYTANWRFADTAGNYLSMNDAPSPVQHFWSLSVEEQFYLVWPLLISLMAMLSHKHRPRTLHLVLALSILALPSAAWSIYLTSSEPDRAYFVSTTRVWEIAVGAFLAVCLAQIKRIPKYVAASLAWCGILAIFVTAFTLTTAVPFPGWIAIIPTLGAAAVIAGGLNAGRLGPALILGTSSMQVIGSLSYALYLWHWPMLIIARAVWDGLDTSQSLLTIALSAVPAYMTVRLVESPVRKSRRLSARPLEFLKFGGLATLAIALTGLFVVLSAWPPPTPIHHIQVLSPAMKGEGSARKEVQPPIGAMTLRANPRGDQSGAPANRPGNFIPSAAQARDDVPSLYADGCHSDQNETEAVYCTSGSPGAKYNVALVGDSHAAQWASPLEEIAVAQNWNLRIYTKSACPLADATVILNLHPYRNCTTWNHNVIESLTTDYKPNLVITSSSTYLVSNVRPSGGDDAMRSGFERSWKRLSSVGARVLVIADTPHPGIDIADCVSTHEGNLKKCSVARSKAVLAGAAQRAATSGDGEARLIDLNDAICPTDSCSPVIGGVLVYRDTNHLTDTYARTLGPRLRVIILSMIRA